jgi:ribosomal protein S6E (S10)
LQRLINHSILKTLLVNFKVVISDKTGKSLSHELKDKDAQPFLGSKIGDTFDSSLVGLSGGGDLSEISLCRW